MGLAFQQLIALRSFCQATTLRKSRNTQIIIILMQQSVSKSISKLEQEDYRELAWLSAPFFREDNLGLAFQLFIALCFPPAKSSSVLVAFAVSGLYIVCLF